MKWLFNRIHQLHYFCRLWLNRRKYPMNVRWKAVMQKKLFNNRCFILKDGSVFSIYKDGDIEGLCRNRGKHTKSGREVIKACVQAGGKKCTGIGEYLYRFYTSNGFSPACWCEFDWRYAPEDATHAEPLIFYYYTNGNKRRIPYKEFLRQQPEKNFVEAYKKRDLCLRRWIRRDQEYF